MGKIVIIIIIIIKIIWKCNLAFGWIFSEDKQGIVIHIERFSVLIAIMIYPKNLFVQGQQ